LINFKKDELAALKCFYVLCGVENGTVENKLSALKNKLGPSLFHAYGNNKTLEMELSALEGVYLLEEGFNI